MLATMIDVLPSGAASIKPKAGEVEQNPEFGAAFLAFMSTAAEQTSAEAETAVAPASKSEPLTDLKLAQTELTVPSDPLMKPDNVAVDAAVKSEITADTPQAEPRTVKTLPEDAQTLKGYKLSPKEQTLVSVELPSVDEPVEMVSQTKAQTPGLVAEVTQPARPTEPTIAPQSNAPVLDTAPIENAGAELIKLTPTALSETGTSTTSPLLAATSQPGPAPAPQIVIQPLPQGQPNLVPDLVALPDDLPDLVTKSIASQNGQDRVVIQLDPPELGRVTIEFKMDANAVQNITIMAETPEMVKRLREMNFELIQAMEKHGLGGRDLGLEYSHSQKQQRPDGQPYALAGRNEGELSLSETEMPIYLKPRTSALGDGLNLKL